MLVCIKQLKQVQYLGGGQNQVKENSHIETRISWVGTFDFGY